MLRFRHVGASPRRRAAAAVELAAVLPILLILLLGIWEVGRVLHVRQVIENAAREGARHAASGQMTDAQVKTAVCNYIKTAGLRDYTSQPDSVVTVANLTHPGADSTLATTLDRIQVTVSVPSADVRWVLVNHFTANNFRISDTAVWYSTRNTQYPTTITSPIGF